MTWIKSEDKIPEEGRYLCCDNSDGFMWTAYADPEHDQRLWDDSHYNRNVTHYMILPERPPIG